MKKRTTVHIQTAGSKITLHVGAMCCATFSKRGYLKALDNAQMIGWALNEVGVSWQLLVDGKPENFATAREIE